ncbi:VOC family protein [Granulicella arctica]|uniref:VOC family protein n=1 Tax=Granulicella arctica TaxID=940613 RepID=UPI0021E0B82D|nr:VOC family protein [Granulicella arctica]
MGLETIGQVGIVVRDLAQAKDFYQHVLGMKFLFDAGSMVFFQCGSVRLMIGTAEAGKPFVAAGTILYFKVADIQESHGALAAGGVTFVAPPHLVAKMPGHDLWMAFLKDPDENVIGLMSEVARAEV